MAQQATTRHGCGFYGIAVFVFWKCEFMLHAENQYQPMFHAIGWNAYQPWVSSISSICTQRNMLKLLSTPISQAASLNGMQ